MRITSVSIQDLFGMSSFTYEIELKTDPPITIIHGPNGSGKTVIFKMITGLFNSNYLIFLKYPFSKFRVEFDDGEHVMVSREYSEKDKEYSFPVINYSKAPKPFIIRIDERFLRRLPPSLRQRLSKESGYFEQLSLFALEENDELYRNTQVARFMEQYADEYFYRQGVEEPSWIKTLSNKLNVRLIDTNRLITRSSGLKERSTRDDAPSVAAIEANSTDLSRRIQSAILKADTQAKTLDRTFPRRVVESVVNQKKGTWRYETIRGKLVELEEKRNRLVEVGLLESGEQESSFQIPEENNNYNDERTLRSVLQIYIRDTDEKLEVYQELAQRIEVFKDIIEEMLRYKKLLINKDGFEVVSDIGRKIPLKELSSGEQHMIVLIYNLLFRTKLKEDELILIDEPEISLHITWQKRFIKNLEKISKLSRFDVIIATHSPAIINGRLDLEVSIQREHNKGK